MNKLSPNRRENVMRKPVFWNTTITALVCLALVGCQTQAEKDSPALTTGQSGGQPWAATPSVSENYPENPTGNIWSPGRKEWVPYYEVPAGWETNPSSRWHLRKTVSGQENSYLTLEYVENQASPLAARDTAYDKTVCLNGENQNAFIDCLKNPEKSETQLAGQKVYQLTYQGTWRGKEEKVQSFYFLNGETTYSARVEGSATDAAEVVEKIMSTLNFREEVFSPQNNPEDLGGI